MAKLKCPMSAKKPAIILPINPPKAIELDKSPIIFGTSFGSFISLANIYGVERNVPCAAPSNNLSIIKGSIVWTTPSPITQIADMEPAISRIFFLPIRSLSFPPIGVIIDNPSEEKIESNEKYFIASIFWRIGAWIVAKLSQTIEVAIMRQTQPACTLNF